jgi:phospholipid/cholesterol/gamma-HCH transport system ATP-binding protein
MSEPDATVLDVQHVVAGYGEQRVLDDVSLTVGRGEIVVVLGGSGSGKSTLLRCIVGLLAPWEGRVLVNGKDVNEAEGRERDAILRDVGMSFQSAALLNSMTVAENVALPIVEHGDADARTALMLARMRLASVGLGAAGDKMPSELSGGMRKRAGLARAMALEPSLLLCDEPSAGLDPITGRELDDLILALKKEGSMAIVVVTHELGSINTIADRAIMLADGKVLAAGPLAQVRADPDERVQAFFNRRTLAERDEHSLLEALERPS